MTIDKNKFQWLIDYVMHLAEKSAQRSDECHTTAILRQRDTEDYPYAKWLHILHDPFDLSVYPDSYLDYGLDVMSYVLRDSMGYPRWLERPRKRADPELEAYERQLENEARAELRREAIRRRSKFGTEGINRWHPDYVELMNASNGLTLFAATIEICGFRLPHPDDVILPGQKTRKLHHPCMMAGEACRISDLNWSLFYPGRSSSEMAIGYYGLDGSIIFQDVQTGEIARRLRDRPEIVNSWEGLDEFLKFEIQRLDCLFDEAGKFLATEETCLLPSQPA